MPKEGWLYLVLVAFFWFAIVATFYVMYRGSSDHDDKEKATTCGWLLVMTPFVPFLLPIAIGLGLIVAILYLAFWWGPEHFMKGTWDNFSITENLTGDKVQKRENLPAPLKPPGVCQLDLMLAKPAENKTIKPVEPKILPKDGKKPSFKEAFGDDEPKQEIP